MRWLIISHLSGSTIFAEESELVYRAESVKILKDILEIFVSYFPTKIGLEPS